MTAPLVALTLLTALIFPPHEPSMRPTRFDCRLACADVIARCQAGQRTLEGRRTCREVYIYFCRNLGTLGTAWCESL